MVQPYRDYKYMITEIRYRLSMYTILLKNNMHDRPYSFNNHVSCSLGYAVGEVSLANVTVMTMMMVGPISSPPGCRGVPHDPATFHAVYGS